MQDQGALLSRSEAQQAHLLAVAQGWPSSWQSHISLHPSQECCCARGREDLQDKPWKISDNIYIYFSWLRRPYRSTREEAAVPAWRCGWAETHRCTPFPTDADFSPRAHASRTLIDPQHLWRPHHARAQHAIHCKTISITQQRHLTHLFHTSIFPWGGFQCRH